MHTIDDRARRTPTVPKATLFPRNSTFGSPSGRKGRIIRDKSIDVDIDSEYASAVMTTSHSFRTTVGSANQFKRLSIGPVSPSRPHQSGHSILAVSQQSFNAPVSTRSNIRELEDQTHRKLLGSFNEEKAGRMSKLERHVSQIKVLDESIKELCSLLRVNCIDHSNLLWKIWSSAADLHGDVYQELLCEIDSLKLQLASKSFQVEELEEKLSTLRRQKGMGANRTGKGNAIDELVMIRQLEEDVNTKDRELLQLQETITNLSLWFPHFAKFGSSVLSRFLPPIGDDDFNSPYLPDKPVGEDSVQDDLKILSNHFHLAQDYLVHDLRRLEQLGIGLDISHNDSTRDHKRNDNPLYVSSRKRQALISNKLSIAINQPEELQALSYGLFGGPQSSVSFSAAAENEYNLRHIDSPIRKSVAPFKDSDITAAVQRAANAVMNGRVSSTDGSKGDIDIRHFNHLQLRRASNLAVVGEVDGTSSESQIDMSNFVLREDMENLEKIHHVALVTLQEIEAQTQQERDAAAHIIETLENELRASQLRERQLRDQLQECKSEADSILVCLPNTCHLPPLLSFDEERARLESVAPWSRGQLLAMDDISKRSMDLLSAFVTIPWDDGLFVGNWGHSHVDNMFNGQSLHLLSVNPLSLKFNHSSSFRSLALGGLIEKYCEDRLFSRSRGIEFCQVLVESTCALFRMEVMEDYQRHKSKERIICSSSLPWNTDDDWNVGQEGFENENDMSAQYRLERLIFYLHLFGINPSVTYPPNRDLANDSTVLGDETDFRSHSHQLHVGLPDADSSVISTSNQPISVPYEADSLSSESQLPPPLINFSEISAKDQSIYFDVTTHCFRATKVSFTISNSGGYIDAAFIQGYIYGHDDSIPITKIGAMVHRVFHVLDASNRNAPPTMTESLLQDKALFVRPWWRFLTPRMVAALKSEALKIAMASNHHCQPSDDLASANLRFHQFSWLCWRATQVMERRLMKVLEVLVIGNSNNFLIIMSPLSFS